MELNHHLQKSTTYMHERAMHNIDETWCARNGWQEKASRLDGTTTCSHTHTLELFSKLVTVLLSFSLWVLLLLHNSPAQLGLGQQRNRGQWKGRWPWLSVL
ncbi:unnamed protein product, partial [Musa hybrid cultivar]